MKSVIALVLVLTSLTATAQTNPPVTVTGSLNIQYNSRTQPGTKGVTDLYTLEVNVANSALFRGTITDTPQIIDGWASKTVVQPRSLKYDVACDVVNPKVVPVDPANPKSVRNVGRLFGKVGITSDGVYHYDTGSVTVDILPLGSAAGFTSKFSGLALGKPLVRPVNWLDTLKCEAVNLTRTVNGRPQTVTLKKYDKMELRQHVIGAGPVQFYQSVTVNGELLYDYDKSCWFFNNMTVQYAEANMVKIDRLTGTIRWVESPRRKVDGQGEYQFDVRVNEQPPAADAAFQPDTADESAFFEADTSIPGLTGVMQYKDAMTSAGTVTASRVTMTLTGNQITKQQAMYLAKLLTFTCVVPFNAE